MKNNIVWLLGFLFLLGSRQVVWGEESSAKTLRMMSYNIHNGIGLDEKTDYARIARVIRTCHPDVVAVQELDSATQRSRKQVVLDELASHTGMYGTFSAAISYSGGKYGIGILSKEKPCRVRRLALPGREEARTLLVAEFSGYFFACTHLSLTEEDRMASLELLKQEAAKADKPFFLAGDWNAHPDEPFMQRLTSDFTLLNDVKKATYPADAPKETIDYIAIASKDTSKVVTLSRKVVEEATASDHRPLCCEVAFKCPAAHILRMKPYLQNPVDNGITVMWQTRVPTYSWVEYGTDKEHLQKAHTLVDGQVICNDTRQKIRLENLKPGQTYYYRVCSQEILLYQAYRKVFGETVQSEFYSFTLPDENTKDFTALIFNDLHKQSATFQSLFRQVKDQPYDFVIFNGDCIDDPSSHEEATRTLQEFTETVNASEVPALFIRGNHEIRNAYSIGLRSLFDYINDKTYHAFSWGDTRFVILDCGEDKPDTHWVYYGLNDFSGLRNEQVDFLKQELRSKDFKQASKHVLLHHIPLYGLDSDYNPCKDAWEKILQKSPFNISINAHTHQFAYLPKGKDGNPYPVVIGGGYSRESATVMLLQKHGKELTLRVLDCDGNELIKMDL